jgi:hypothetical protein
MHFCGNAKEKPMIDVIVEDMWWWKRVVVRNDTYGGSLAIKCLEKKNSYIGMLVLNINITMSVREICGESIC